ncbi:MAG: 4Fe-4S dicluster domain-containing protein [Chloroflexi bacterium]|nr:4Fe-4S dicluster domain-containing protein [Chloroflexota bacterium]
MAEKSVLFDTTKCIACRACQVACKQWWELPATLTANRGTYENPPDLSAETWNKIRFEETGGRDGTVRWLFTRQACMHCTEAPCVWVCPTYARTHHALGYVSTDQERCIGCGRCVEFCPFEVPRLDGDNISPRVTVKASIPRTVAYKCKFCEDRLAEGLSPSCVKTCPTGALQFGDRTMMVEQGRGRVAGLAATHPRAYLYGENELRGLHVMYVLTDDPHIYGLPDKPRLGVYPEFDENTFPDWYVKAVAGKSLPLFPPEARPDWYMQPKLAPTPGPPEPESPKRLAGRDMGWGGPALSGWLAIGVVGALSWVIRRKSQRGQE